MFPNDKTIAAHAAIVKVRENLQELLRIIASLDAENKKLRDQLADVLAPHQVAPVDSQQQDFFRGQV